MSPLRSFSVKRGKLWIYSGNISLQIALLLFNILLKFIWPWWRCLHFIGKSSIIIAIWSQRGLESVGKYTVFWRNYLSIWSEYLEQPDQELSIFFILPLADSSNLCHTSKVINFFSGVLLHSWDRCVSSQTFL